MNQIRTVLLVFASACAYPACAQSPEIRLEAQPAERQKIAFTGGASVEANLSGFFHSGVDNGNSIAKAGFSVGGFLNLGITRSFSVQGEMLFHNKNSRFTWGSSRGDFAYWGMEIPLYVMYHYSFPKGDRLHIGLGPYTEFGFGATFRQEGKKADLYEKDGSTGLPALQDSNTGFGLKIGYEFVSGFQINASCKASYSNQLDANSSQIKMHPYAISAGVAYRFGK